MDSNNLNKVPPLTEWHFIFMCLSLLLHLPILIRPDIGATVADNTQVLHSKAAPETGAAVS